MVNARAAEQGRFSIDEKTLHVPGQGAETEEILRLIHYFSVPQQLDTAAIELRVFGIPQAGRRDFERQLRRACRGGLGCDRRDGLGRACRGGLGCDRRDGLGHNIRGAFGHD